MKINSAITVLLCFVTFVSIAQSNQGKDGLWKQSLQPESNLDIPVKKAVFYDVDLVKFKSTLKKCTDSHPVSISVPMSNGAFETFILTPSGIMSDVLAQKFPDIRAYNGISADGKTWGKFDVTPKGFHGMVFSSEGLVFIDPVSRSSKNTYQSYYKSDFIPSSKTPLGNDQLSMDEISTNKKIDVHGKRRKLSRASGTELRTYRMAITTTGEYSDFHGGTVADALSAIVTTMNRVNGIYEREVAITMELIGNTDELIYLDADTDPYSNNSASSYIDEVQTNIDDIIGDANYDIGHGFSTGAGGLAGPGPCVSGNKATGITGTSSPVGDPYDVDYVAHEIGHQFGANHTFNGTSGSCSGGNRNASTAYEPGSGTTILAYAGICSPQNIQSNSDAYMHTASYDEILAYSVDGSGNSCPVITSTGNNPPIVDAGTGGFTIPINTPFALTGSANDPDGDDITYSWEQFDLGPAGAPGEPEDNAPLFRSFPPKDEPTRVFPDVTDIIDNTQTQGELLPDYERSLTFRLTARDNKNGGGGVANDEISFNVSESAGPFLVTSFNSSDDVTAQSNIIIDWDVAATNEFPVNCQLVNILLSEDGGLTYPYELKSNTTNDGSELVLIPDIVTSTARIKVEAADNIFFDINDADFSISAPSNPGYNINLQTNALEICAPDNGQVDISVGSVLGYTDDVSLSIDGLADGLTSQFSANHATPGNVVTLTIEDTNLGADGTYELTLNATSTSGNISNNFTITVYDQEIESVALNVPADEAVEVELKPGFSWEELPGNNMYEIEIATDEMFNEVTESVSGLTSNSYSSGKLEPNTIYFWRVKGTNTCQTTAFTEASFTTINVQCTEQPAEDMPKSIGTAPVTITSTIEVEGCGTLTELKINELKGSHTWISDLTVSLTSPSGTEVILFSRICDDMDDFDLNFDNDAINTIINCPPTDQGIYQPQGDFEDFYGEVVSGTWTLTVEDGFNQDGGSLDSWSLEFCVQDDISVPNDPSELSAELISETQINLNWTDNSDNEAEFIIERSKGDNLNYEELDRVLANVITYSDIVLTEQDEYFYRVKATTASCVSQPSEEISIINLLPPAAPSDLQLELISLSQVNLSWDDNSDDEDGFIIERSKGDNANYTVLEDIGPDNLSFIDFSLEEPTVYFYRLKAYNMGGESETTAEMSVNSIVLAIDDDKANSKFYIYPNPGNGLYKILIAENSTVRAEFITVYDMVGNLIFSKEAPDNANEYQVDLSAFPKGIYIVNIQANESKATMKVIKE